MWPNTNTNNCYLNNIRILFEYQIIRSPRIDVTLAFDDVNSIHVASVADVHAKERRNALTKFGRDFEAEIW